MGICQGSLEVTDSKNIVNIQHRSESIEELIT